MGCVIVFTAGAAFVVIVEAVLQAGEDVLLEAAGETSGNHMPLISEADWQTLGEVVLGIVGMVLESRTVKRCSINSSDAMALR